MRSSMPTRSSASLTRPCFPLPESEEGGTTFLTDHGHEIRHGHGQCIVEIERLGHVAHDGSAPPTDAYLPGVRHLAEHAADKRRLAAAVGPDNAVDGPLLHGKTHVVQDGVAAELQADVFKVDRRTLPARKGSHVILPASWNGPRQAHWSGLRDWRAAPFRSRPWCTRHGSGGRGGGCGCPFPHESCPRTCPGNSSP